MTLASGTRLGPYEILAPLGAGGMGEVYRARDSKLDRDVAIKVLPETVASSPDALRRFEREAKAVAALSHPHILSIHDFGTHEGVSYAVTELLEGETLRSKLSAGPIPQKQALDYGLQIAKGLSAAHERGIVHRDLKPENLFVTKDGHLKILDFGLAKKTQPVSKDEETSSPTESGYTEPGAVLGTVGYMSPEQVRGLPVDHRSDIFSFGAILYELLSGRRAFKRATPADTLSAILKEEPPGLGQRDVPAALDGLVRHCLEKDRENRFQSVRDIAFAISESSRGPTATGIRLLPPPRGPKRLVIAAAAAAILAAAGIALLRRPGQPSGESPRVKRVAVLPFENLGAPEDDYFADGIADEVRGKLTSLSEVEVIARASSIPYKETAKTPQEIARELDVGYLLTATVRWQKSGGANRVVVRPELVEIAEKGAPRSKWQQPFDAALTDVFQVQSEIATRVAQALGVALAASEEKKLGEKPTENLAAYDAFLKGEEVANDGIWRALTLYDRAVALDPSFAQAWARLSQANSQLFDFSPAPESRERARTAAEKAIGLAPDAPEGYLALGDYHYLVLYDTERALEQFARGRRLSRGNSDLLAAVATAEAALGRWQSAELHARQAERLDPRSIRPKESLAAVLRVTGRNTEARRVMAQAVALAPANLGLIHAMAMDFLVEGDLAGARAVIQAAPKEVDPTALVAHLATFGDLVWVLDDQQLDVLLRLTPAAFTGREIWALCLTQAYALRGDLANTHRYADEARRVFEEQIREAPRAAVSHALLGLAFAYLGRKDEAIREGQLGVALQPVSQNAWFGPYHQHQLARIYILVGQPEKALDQLERLVKTPYVLTPGWLKIDPNFDPLRKNPRFQKLVAGA